MNLNLWPIRKPLAGQSRPNGLFLERIPVHEVEETEADQSPRASLEHGGGDALIDDGLSRIQDELAALRKSIANLTTQLGVANARAAVRGALIRDRDTRLRVARQKLAELGATRSVLDSLTAPVWQDDDPVANRPDRC